MFFLLKYPNRINRMDSKINSLNMIDPFQIHSLPIGDYKRKYYKFGPTKHYLK